MSDCKLARNQAMLVLKHEIKYNEIAVVSETKQRKGMTLKYCLNCDAEIVSRADKPNIFCTAKCADEYYKKKRGLL